MQTPTKYVHKHFKPAEFSTGACVLKKEVTKASEKVLYRYAHEKAHRLADGWCRDRARGLLFLQRKP